MSQFHLMIPPYISSAWQTFSTAKRKRGKILFPKPMNYVTLLLHLKPRIQTKESCARVFTMNLEKAGRRGRVWEQWRHTDEAYFISSVFSLFGGESC